MITDSQYDAWQLSDSATPCLLIETTPFMGGADTTLYLSSRGYTTGPTDTVVANKEYLPIIQGGVRVTEAFSVDGTASMSYGTVDLENKDGGYDAWLDAVWYNRGITVLFGDVTWARSDFRVVFKGIVEDISSSGRDRLNLKLRDILQLLNNPISEAILGGTTSNKDRLRPNLLGEAFNFEPLLIDPANHEYQFHYGSAEKAIEVRDDGVPITVTPTLSAGTFRLTQTPVGTITVSAQGDNNGGYASTLVGIVKKLVKNYGRVGSRLTDADLDLTSLSSFDAANQQAMGIYVSDKANVLETCQGLAASIGAMVTTSRQGLLQIVQLKAATGAAGAPVVTEDDMVLGTLRIVERTKVSGAVKLGYCQNWSPQNDLQTGLPEAHKVLLSEPWMMTTQLDQSVIDLYRLPGVPEQEDTYLLSEADAIAEASRRLAFRKVLRTVYQYTGYADALSFKLGQEIFLKHSRYGLSAGKYGVIVGLEPDWLGRRCNVKVMI